jgi:hypothetical protein
VTDPHSFALEILEQGWLEGASAERDLCSHGRLRLVIAGLTIADEHERSRSAADAGIRSRREHPVAERLIFHGCGAILMMGCPIGIDWSCQAS